jgi:LCP family protein required for cell wall assembly
MLFVFDNDNKKCSALHINRDTMAELGVLGVNGNRVSTRTAQIALAHTYGNGRDTSCRNTVDAVSELLYGAKINHYISFTMDSVSVINDMVGGVEVEVLDDLTALDPSFTKGERVLLSGEQALSYVRSRRELPDSTNKTRMVRQQQYINSLWEKASKLLSEDAEALASSAYKLSDYIVSDRSLTQLEALAKKIASYEFAGIFELSGENFIGEKYIEFYPDEQSVLENVTKLFYKLKD